MAAVVATAKHVSRSLGLTIASEDSLSVPEDSCSRLISHEVSLEAEAGIRSRGGEASQAVGLTKFQIISPAKMPSSLKRSKAAKKRIINST